MVRRSDRKNPTPTPRRPLSPAHYSEASERVFRAALESLSAKLPEHHQALLALLEAGKLHDADSLQAVLEGGAR